MDEGQSPLFHRGSFAEARKVIDALVDLRSSGALKIKTPALASWSFLFVRGLVNLVRPRTAGAELFAEYVVERGGGGLLTLPALVVKG